MEHIYILIFSFLITIIVGVIGYWLKTAHTEFKGLIRHLTDYTTQLKELIIGIQTQLEKGVEADIKEIKMDVQKLYAKSNKNESQIATLQQQVKS